MGYNSIYYTIGQVSKIAGLPQSVLRYWETVFELLDPPKSTGGTRQYTEMNVEMILEIKKLLYDEGYTIKGANKHIDAKYSKSDTSEDINSKQKIINQLPNGSLKSTVDNSTLQQIKQRIHSILELLEE